MTDALEDFWRKMLKKNHKQNNKIKTTQKSTEKQKQQLSNIWNVLSFNLALVAKLRLHAKGEMR